MKNARTNLINASHSFLIKKKLNKKKRNQIKKTYSAKVLSELEKVKRVTSNWHSEQINYRRLVS